MTPDKNKLQGLRDAGAEEAYPMFFTWNGEENPDAINYQTAYYKGWDARDAIATETQVDPAAESMKSFGYKETQSELANLRETITKLTSIIELQREGLEFYKCATHASLVSDYGTTAEDTLIKTAKLMEGVK